MKNPVSCYWYDRPISLKAQVGRSNVEILLRISIRLMRKFWGTNTGAIFGFLAVAKLVVAKVVGFFAVKINFKFRVHGFLKRFSPNYSR